MISKVLVGVDFSEASRTALATGLRWAEKLGVPLVAMHVVQVPKFFLEEAYPSTSELEWTRSLEEKARKRMHSWVEGFAEVSLSIVSGSPAEELVAAADPNTLLVVGQVGHSVIEHLLFGSTAARVTRHAPCDVLVVRQAKPGKERGS